jgi:hypothetical protein
MWELGLPPFDDAEFAARPPFHQLCWESFRLPTRARRLTDDEIGALRAEAAGAVLALLEGRNGSELGEILRQAIDGYEEQDRRAERTERRAVAMQNSMSVVAALIAVGGGLLVGASSVYPGPVRLIFASLVLISVSLMVMAALYALQASADTQPWHRPNTPRSIEFRLALRAEEFYAETVGALLVATQRNMRFADWKTARLRRARDLYRLALISILVLATTVVVYAAGCGG